MNFIEALRSFIGRSVELVQPGQFLQGRLASAADGIVTIEIASTSYIPAAEVVTVFSNNITFIRILP
ncbi:MULTISPECIES: hypothetical protein [Paenibacillus]|uniref:Uncharacterized protein n=2 Tax=Paenibacillus lactis TaxID=228574 RepID=G4HAI8_9BACL|nr:hypothetical protein [Paenibacillus lactis]EHB66947.1 hypothetical protein PaelaDRAFT_1171 [Paenibacillus lactis 154]MBP1895385.1 hypothetical protein [Paenibacillus lactis]HAF97859.1 hypothetical protein [Paenibacillus lactis]